MYCQMLFSALCVLIVFGGGFEIIRLQFSSHQLKWLKFCILYGIYILTGFLFFLFGIEKHDVQSFTLLIVCTFDAFSQLSGQLFGKRKICPRISPNKTIGGTVGGAIVSMIVSVIVGYHTGWDKTHVFIIGLGIATASFTGDLAASYVKRQFAIKDFSRIFPQHGGFLDRFDSLIFAGAFVYLFQLFWQ